MEVVLRNRDEGNQQSNAQHSTISVKFNTADKKVDSGGKNDTSIAKKNETYIAKKSETVAKKNETFIANKNETVGKKKDSFIAKKDASNKQHIENKTSNKIMKNEINDKNNHTRGESSRKTPEKFQRLDQKISTKMDGSMTGDTTATHTNNTDDNSSKRKSVSFSSEKILKRCDVRPSGFHEKFEQMSDNVGTSIHGGVGGKAMDIKESLELV